MKQLAFLIALLISTPSFGNGGHPPPAPKPPPATATLAATSTCGFTCWLPFLAVAGLIIYLSYEHNHKEEE